LISSASSVAACCAVGVGEAAGAVVVSDGEVSVAAAAALSFAYFLGQCKFYS